MNVVGAFSRPRDSGPPKKEVRRSDTYPGAVNLAPSILLGLTEKIRKKGRLLGKEHTYLVPIEARPCMQNLF